MRQKSVLLAFIESVNLVDEHNRRTRVQALLSQLRFFDCIPNVFHTTEHRANRYELGVKSLRHQTCQRRLAYTGRAPQNAAVRLTTLKSQPQGQPFTQQMILPNHITQCFRTQALR